MTREEAISIIRKMLACTDLSVRANLTADMVDACHLAIKALEQEPTIKNDLGADCISREKTLGYTDIVKNLEQMLYIESVSICKRFTSQEIITFTATINALKSLQSISLDLAFENDELEEKLKQEPSLDKIRAEIKALTSNRGFLSCSVDYIHEEIDAVFDKFKT